MGQLTKGAKPKKTDLISAIKNHNLEVMAQFERSEPAAQSMVEVASEPEQEVQEPQAEVESAPVLASPSLVVTDAEKDLYDEMAGFLSGLYERYYVGGAEDEAPATSGQEVDLVEGAQVETELNGESQPEEPIMTMTPKEKGKAKAKTTVSKTKPVKAKAPKAQKAPGSGAEEACKLYDECGGNIKTGKEKSGKSDAYVRRMFKGVEVYRSNEKIKNLIDGGKITFWKLHAALAYKTGVADLEKLAA